MAAMGVEVTLIDQRPQLLDFVDREIIEALAYHLRQMGTTFRLGDKVTRVGIDEQRDRVFAELESGKKVQANALLYAVGRQANGDQLNLEAAGLEPDPRGKVMVNDWISCLGEHIDGAGQIVELPYVRIAVGEYVGAVPLRDLHDTGNFDGGADRREINGGESSL
jgi:NAD(P) transhydrogenase